MEFRDLPVEPLIETQWGSIFGSLICFSLAVLHRFMWVAVVQEELKEADSEAERKWVIVMLSLFTLSWTFAAAIMFLQGLDPYF